jgi:spermidine synthase
VPTVLMGSTLPILVAHLVRISGNVGTSVGILYFVNTLGSAVACLMSAKFIMRMMGESGSVHLAASINGVIGALALVAFFLRRKHREQVTETGGPHPETIVPRESVPLLFPWAVLAVGLCGFISLAYEILWYRVYSFASGSSARAFALLLGAYLEGIAFGSLLSRPFCERISGKKASGGLIAIALFAFAANAFSFFVAPLMTFGVQSLSLVLTLPLVTISTCLLGALFPLICHASIQPDYRVGARLSYLYLSNIVGSVSGTLLVGFILMDYWPIREISVFLASLGFLLGLGFLWTVLRGIRLAAAVAAAGLASALIAASSKPLFERAYERMLYKNDYRPTDHFAHLIESKRGVIAVATDGTVFGGGVIDGRFNTSPLQDTNWIVRAYAISSFHPLPRKVLMIGLSSGSWAQVIANHPQVEKLTIVEINPAYLRLIPQYPQVAGLLRNPKVEIVIDDGRRWLIRNPSQKFDVIAMNSSYHWREHASNLLSVDFLQLARPHLLPGGVLFYNTTASGEAQLTGATVYPYALRVINFLAVSDSPIRVDKDRWKSVLENYQIEGKPVFDFTRPYDRKRFAEILSMADTVESHEPEALMAMEYAGTIRERFRGRRLITDDNMGTEWLEMAPH